MAKPQVRLCDFGHRVSSGSTLCAISIRLGADQTSDSITQSSIALVTWNIVDTELLAINLGPHEAMDKE